MKAMKIRVFNHIHSTRVQKLLFILGYEWHSCGDTVTNTSACMLYTHESGSITYSTPYDEYEEYTEEDLLESVTTQMESGSRLNKLSVEIINMLIEIRKTLTNELAWVDEQIVRQVEMLNKD